MPLRERAEVRLARHEAGCAAVGARRHREQLGVFLAVVFPVVFDQLVERNRAVKVDVYARVQNARQGLQNFIGMVALIVDVAVDHIAALFVEDRVMAQEDVRAAVVDLQKVCHAVAVVQQTLGVVQAGVVVAADEMQAAIQAGEILRRGLAAVVGEVADDVYAVVCADAGVPVGNEGLVHLRHAGKRPRRVVQDGEIAEMQVSGVEDHGDRSFRRMLLQP